MSKSFAAKKGLKFKDERHGDSRVITLSDSQIEIEAKVSDNRLRIVALGPVNERSLDLSTKYDRVAQQVSRDCPQCAWFVLDEVSR